MTSLWSTARGRPSTHRWWQPSLTTSSQLSAGDAARSPAASREPDFRAHLHQRTHCLRSLARSNNPYDVLGVAAPSALADCNNFFVSCECAFQPALHGKPVVLSNNDGCVIARSNEKRRLASAWVDPRHLSKVKFEKAKFYSRTICPRIGSEDGRQPSQWKPLIHRSERSSLMGASSAPIHTMDSSHDRTIRGKVRVAVLHRGAPPSTSGRSISY
ncbi:hypothetical protein [Rhodopseudomonas pentothenatexigens]|nr:MULTISPECIES: hypothetical protein [Rhodopseudomonas]